MEHGRSLRRHLKPENTPPQRRQVVNHDERRIAEIQRLVAVCSVQHILAREVGVRPRSQEPRRLSVLVQRDGVVELVLDDEIHHGADRQAVYDRLLQRALGARAAQVREEEGLHGAPEELPGLFV